MRSIIAALAGPATALGVILLAYAAFTPFRYNLGFASAIQVSQVYGEGAYYALLAVGVLLFAAIGYLGQIQSAATPAPSPAPATPEKAEAEKS